MTSSGYLQSKSCNTPWQFLCHSFLWNEADLECWMPSQPKPCWVQHTARMRDGHFQFPPLLERDSIPYLPPHQSGQLWAPEPAILPGQKTLQIWMRMQVGGEKWMLSFPYEGNHPKGRASHKTIWLYFHSSLFFPPTMVLSWFHTDAGACIHMLKTHPIRYIPWRYKGCKQLSRALMKQGQEAVFHTAPSVGRALGPCGNSWMEIDAHRTTLLILRIALLGLDTQIQPAFQHQHRRESGDCLSSDT